MDDLPGWPSSFEPGRVRPERTMIFSFRLNPDYIITSCDNQQIMIKAVDLISKCRVDNNCVPHLQDDQNIDWVVMVMMTLLMNMMMMKKEKMNMALVYFVHCHQSLQGLLLSFHRQLKQICLIQVLGIGHDDLGNDNDLYDLDDFNYLGEYFSTEEVRGACLLSPVSDACPHL